VAHGLAIGKNVAYDLKPARNDRGHRPGHALGFSLFPGVDLPEGSPRLPSPSAQSSPPRWPGC
jgi:hypothetical protein